jgi:hypothetical protein
MEHHVEHTANSPALHRLACLAEALGLQNARVLQVLRLSILSSNQSEMLITTRHSAEARTIARGTRPGGCQVGFCFRALPARALCQLV